MRIYNRLSGELRHCLCVAIAGVVFAAGFGGVCLQVRGARRPCLASAFPANSERRAVSVECSFCRADGSCGSRLFETLAGNLLTRSDLSCTEDLFGFGRFGRRLPRGRWQWVRGVRDHGRWCADRLQANPNASSARSIRQGSALMCICRFHPCSNGQACASIGAKVNRCKV